MAESPDPPTTPETRHQRMKRYATLGVIIGTGVWTTFFFGFLVLSMLAPQVVPESWFLDMIRQHPAGTLGLAMGAISAFSVVAVLDVFARDPIEIKFFQFELKGAAGPVVLWVICFLAFIAATDALWENTGTNPPPRVSMQNNTPVADARQ
ncbi:hypothetical protein [Nitrogeniibacter aestuarii]|uniref:hypothetical protein n=1 Tax=Nitrogeniibacter aestuarii TaxID=2815343 RepID=UPI001E58A5CF|nr:hypothetical protein [Nitrogeniibacter aestuarii]